MRAPDAAELLALVDDPLRGPPLERVRLLLEAAWPGEDIRADTPGQRNRRLLALRRALFGWRIPCVANCPACGTLLELELDIDELAAAGETEARPEPVTLSSASGPLRFRLPTVADLSAASGAATPEDAVRTLALACCIEGNRAQLGDPDLLSMLSAALEAADPLGHIELDLACAECAARTQLALDLGAVLLSEIDALAERLLAEVHALASAYGWSERDILALPAPRRRRYLALLAA